MTKLGSRLHCVQQIPYQSKKHSSAFLSSEGVNVFAWKDETEKEYLDN